MTDELDQEQDGQLRKRNVQSEKEGSQSKNKALFNLSVREVISNPDFKPFQPPIYAEKREKPLVQRSSNLRDWKYNPNGWDKYGRQLLPGMLESILPLLPRCAPGSA